MKVKSLFVYLFIFVLCFNLSYSVVLANESEATEPVAETTKPKKATQTKSKSNTTKAEKKGETLSSLIKSFKSVHKDIEFAEKYVNPKADDFDKTMAKALANDLLKWKKTMILVKKLKKEKSPKLKSTEEKLRELEENIIAKYTESATPSDSITNEETTSTSDEEASEEQVAKTQKGKEILEKLKQKQAGENKLETNNEKSTPSNAPTVTTEPSRIRISPSRALYNRLEPGSEASTKITIKNLGKKTFEGTVVPIENWITVNPTVVTIEPGSSIDVEVSIVAQSTPRSRLEGSVELRTEGESSRRIPVVIRTK